MKIQVVISTVADGNMLIHEDKANREVVLNRTAFLKKNTISIDQASRVDVTYDTTNFKRYREVTISDMKSGMLHDDTDPADALVTRQSEHALFLPLADCVGMVIFDPMKHILMLSHIGRHSLEQNGAYESVQFLVTTYDCDPATFRVWLTPAPGIGSYPLFAFNNRAFKDVLYEQLKSAGVSAAQITDNPSDTATDDRYFSHSEFLKGNRTTDGRYAVVAMMHD